MRTLCTSILTLLLVGCASRQTDNAAIKGVSPETASELNAKQTDFDSVKDPPLNANTRFAAGQLAESRNPAAAVEQYRAAIHIEPMHAPSLFRLGVLYAQARRYPEAIATWKQYVKATHESATAYGNLAFCHEVAGQPREAEAAYLAGIERDPKNSLCRLNYGLMLARLNRIGEAREQLSAILKPAQVHYNLGSVHEIVGRHEDAKSEYEQALELDPAFWDAKQRLQRLEGLSAAR